MSLPLQTPVPAPSATRPTNPAQGNQRGQTTLAAELDRWQTLADRLATQVDEMPWLA